MIIQVDSREKAKAISGIVDYFDSQGIKHFVSKLWIGDYMNYDNPRLIIDRKQNLNELCGNVCQEHERFRKELIRAQDNEVQLIILCEHGQGIETLEDVLFWDNPRRHVRKRIDGRWTTVETKAITGEHLYNILCTLAEKYGVVFEFCEKSETGKKIVQILSNDS